MQRPLCRKCGVMLDSVLTQQKFEYHPSCEPEDRLTHYFLDEIKSVIRWADSNSTRSVQTDIGPSEIGDPCDRKIAYRLAQIPERNTWSDPLPAIVGTAFHHWMEKAVNKYQAHRGMRRWETELTVHPDPLIKGHNDLYDRQRQAIIDYKTLSPTRLEEWQKKGPKESHKDQVNLYARGAIASGRPVRQVALLGVPRSGWMRDMQLWIGDYEPQRAQSALDRMYGIADLLIQQGADLDFAAIPAEPGFECSYCPWYRGKAEKADGDGCPGQARKVEEKFGKGLIAPKNDIQE